MRTLWEIIDMEIRLFILTCLATVLMGFFHRKDNE